MSVEKPKRRWYQFSLLTLLVVMTLFTVTVGWVGSRMHRARENRDRVTVVEIALEKLGVLHNGKYEERRPQTWLEELFDDPGGSDDPVRVLTITNIIVADLDDTTVEHLKKLPDIKSLAFTSLNTDAGLERLKGMICLETLYIGGAQVTDRGLEHLKGLAHLQSLHCMKTSVTDEGVKKLQKALPNCDIHYRRFPPFLSDADSN